ncbi:MAG TPA: hypothetical protein VJC21_05705 [Candidatus Nanoarchaeia archaeon]|nr:hypothetical protein [Candidatus Nanoarchaeia archaeon]
MWPKLKYPKLFLLAFTFIIAYILFAGRDFLPFHTLFVKLGYLGTFITGILFSYGFTAAPATAILLILSREQNIFLAGFIAGLGALIGDLLIFKLIRRSFAGEIEKLSQETPLRRLNHAVPKTLKKYLIAIVAGFIIASPLPDEIGVSLLAATRTLSTKVFSLFSYLLNTTGIFVILSIGRAI